MLKNGAVNGKIVRPVVSKKIEKPTAKIEKSKHDENKEKTTSIGATSSKKTVAATSTKKLASNPDVVTKSQINSKPVTSKPKQVTPVAMKPKISSTATSKVIKQQPMKAIHQVQVKRVVTEKNVMNTVHNVTVSSPPPVRKEQKIVEEIVDTLPRERTKTRTPGPEEVVDTLPRERTKTRTLGPEEVVLLKQAKSDEKTTKVDQKPVVVQHPVAYEITFEKPITSKAIESSSEQPQDVSSDGDYEDDFDSYESDFETESSTSSRTASTKSENESGSISAESDVLPSGLTSTKRLDDDREFDSGTYELKGVAEKVQLDSIDERELHSEGQNDSGFGYNNATPSPIEQTHSTSSSIFSKPSVKPTYNKRGMELMKKISLDTMTFTLFELKPLSYDLYMKIYGQKNTKQRSSQTAGNMIDQDAQTENKAKHSMWTQYPPNFVSNITENYHEDRLGCGEGSEDVVRIKTNDDCALENSLKIINRNNVLRDVRTTKPIDYERLNFFLQKSAITMSGICDASVTSARDLQKSDSAYTDGFFRIAITELEILKGTSVYYMYSNPVIENVVYLAHRQRSSSRTHDNSFVSVWNILEPKKPIRLLSCWSLVICLEVHSNFQDVVIGGLTDGCLALWNFNESTFWHQNSDLRAIPPTHIVSASIDTKPINFDFGCIVSLKSLQSGYNIHDDDFKLTQVCSLHEFGILTVWTILHSNSHTASSDAFNDRKIDHRSPWSRFQLIQSSIIDLATMNLNKKLRPKSGFEKKKMYFESNLFNDAALRELHDFDAQKGLLDQSECFRCVDMECHDDEIVVATNKSFLIVVATSLNKGSVRKLLIDDSNLLHATKLKSLDDVLLIGLTDGSVKVLRLKSSNVCHKTNDGNSKNVPAGAPFDENNFNAKSCAIQNIIKEERKFFDDGITMDRFKQTDNVIDDSTTIGGNRFINNQILLPAMSTNRDFVRWMDVSVNLNSMMSLCGERLRIIDFENAIEDRVGNSDNDVRFATIVSGFNQREYLVNLEEDNVRVHLLRKKNR